MNESRLKERLQKLIEKYAALMQSDIILLHSDGTVFLASDRSPSGAAFFDMPLDQCIDQPIQIKSSHDYSLSPYYYCLPVTVDGSLRFFVVISGFDNTKIARECVLVATGLSELIAQFEASPPEALPEKPRDPQAQVVEYICANRPAEQIKTLLQTFKFSPVMLRSVICIEFSFGSVTYFEGMGNIDYEIQRDNTCKKMLNFVRNHIYFNKQDISSIVNKTELVIIKAFPVNSNISKAYKTLDAICYRLLNDLSEFGMFKMRMAHGNLTTECSSLYASYAEARSFLEMGIMQHPDGKYFNAENLMLEQIYKDLHPQISEKVIAPMLESLKMKNGELCGELLQCAEALVDCCMSYSAVSQKLMLHRNTVHSRVERFCEITGLDPVHHFYDAVAVKLAAISQRQEKANGMKEREYDR